MAASDDTVVKSYCTKCRGITKHIVIKEVERSLSPDNTPGMGGYPLRTIKQLGPLPCRYPSNIPRADRSDRTAEPFGRS
jgi:hypothetical protein